MSIQNEKQIAADCNGEGKTVVCTLAAPDNTGQSSSTADEGRSAG